MEQRLAAYSYLWTSGEWTLSCSHHARARVVFVFSRGHPSPQELISIRGLIPRFSEAPTSVVKAEVGALAEFVAGEFGHIEARRLELAAQQRGLQVRWEDTSFTSFFPVSTQGTMLLIENDEFASHLIAEMRRQGVPVVSQEEHD